MRGVLRLWAASWGFAVLCVLCSLCSAGRARAEAPSPRANPVHVLGIDSDDAEDQADALTGALRSRVRSAPGLSLQETQHSLGMLTAALRCPSKPDAPCLQKIGDQLRADRFVWGTVTKAPGNQVAAEVHLWTRGKPDAAAKETYSDNLKDQNDETLRRIATRILERLTGSATTGTVTVHAGDAEGTVWVDGQKKRALEHGAATIDLPPGSYQVEVRAKGYVTSRQDGVVVGAGQDTSVPFKLTIEAATAPETVATESGKGVNVRRVIAFGLIGAGVVAEIVAGVEAVRFLNAKNDLDNARAQVDKKYPDVCASNVAFNGAAQTACSKFNDAKDARTVGVLVASGGAVAIAAGFVLLFTEHSREGSSDKSGDKSTASADRLRVLPYAAPRGAGVDLSFTF